MATTLVTGAVVAAVPAVSNAATSFNDVTDPALHYYKPVRELVERGVVKGYDDGTYRPNACVTRAQSAKILAHVLGLDTVNVTDPGFSDVKKGTTYYGPVAALANAGYIKGYEENGSKLFKPNNHLTRAQMAKILTLGFDLKDQPVGSNRFDDVKSEDAYAGYVGALLALDITTGTTPTTFSPNAFVTRGQIATFVIRTETALKEVAPEEPNIPDPTPPNEVTGNQLLHASIQTELAKANSVTDKVYITLHDHVLHVTVKDSTSTVKDFFTAAKPVSHALKNNTIIHSMTISMMIGGETIKIIESDIDSSQNFEAVMKSALAKISIADTTAMTLVQGRTITLHVVGTTDTKNINSTYDFKFH